MSIGNTVPASRNFAGVGGAFETHPYEVSEFRLGSQVFSDIVGYRVVSRKAYSSAADGVIGTEMITRFNVLLDYPNERIYLWPNESEGVQLP